MRSKLKQDEGMPVDLGMPIDQVMAIGLVWGHLSSRQFEEAYLLAKGCLYVWPDEHNLTLMYFYAADKVLAPEGTAVAPFADTLDTRLTVGNPAWGADPVPGMRTLRKTMIAALLQLEEDDRKDLLAAIKLVEKAVQMRLLLQQMCKNEAVLLIKSASKENI